VWFSAEHARPAKAGPTDDAVRQWEFTPTIVNGVAVPVITTVTVNFTLQTR